MSGLDTMRVYARRVQRNSKLGHIDDAEETPSPQQKPMTSSARRASELAAGVDRPRLVGLAFRLVEVMQAPLLPATIFVLAGRGQLRP